MRPRGGRDARGEARNTQFNKFCRGCAAGEVLPVAALFRILFERKIAQQLELSVSPQIIEAASTYPGYPYSIPQYWQSRYCHY
eukprot:3803290-Rhodomonas_salina.1